MKTACRSAIYEYVSIYKCACYSDDSQHISHKTAGSAQCHRISAYILGCTAGNSVQFTRGKSPMHCSEIASLNAWQV